MEQLVMKHIFLHRPAILSADAALIHVVMKILKTVVAKIDRMY